MLPHVLSLLDFTAGPADIAPPASDIVCVGPVFRVVDASAVYLVTLPVVLTIEASDTDVVEVAPITRVVKVKSDRC